jgi:hypothetical protein
MKRFLLLLIPFTLILFLGCGKIVRDILIPGNYILIRPGMVMEYEMRHYYNDNGSQSLVTGEFSTSEVGPLSEVPFTTELAYIATEEEYIYDNESHSFTIEVSTDYSINISSEGAINFSENNGSYNRIKILKYPLTLNKSWFVGYPFGPGNPMYGSIVQSGQTITVPHGTYTDVIKAVATASGTVEIDPGVIADSDITMKVWLAQEVGIIKREISIHIVRGLYQFTQIETSELSRLVIPVE